MKTSYLQWNRDTVNDNLIVKQLESFPRELTINTDQFRETSDIVRGFKRKNQTIKTIPKIKQKKTMGAFEIVEGKNSKEK